MYLGKHRWHICHSWDILHEILRPHMLNWQGAQQSVTQVIWSVEGLICSKSCPWKGRGIGSGRLGGVGSQMGLLWLFQAKRFKKDTRESACIVGFVCENPKIRPSYSQISNICLPGLNMTLWLQYVLATLSPRNAMDLWVYCGLC